MQHDRLTADRMPNPGIQCSIVFGKFQPDTRDVLIPQHIPRCTEHILHLSAHHVISNVNINPNIHTNTAKHLRTSELTDDTRDEDENINGEFVTGDVIGKILALLGVVSYFRWTYWI
jgi:hypothetical protein